MAKLLNSATMSLDGFIAGPGGDASWMTPYVGPNPGRRRARPDHAIPGPDLCLGPGRGVGRFRRMLRHWRYMPGQGSPPVPGVHRPQRGRPHEDAIPRGHQPRALARARHRD